MQRQPERYLHNGILAIDIDGTALIESWGDSTSTLMHGFKNDKSTIRPLIIDLIRLAITNNYEIYIVTARPAIEDKFFELIEGKVGTKSTVKVIAELNAELAKLNDPRMRINPKNVFRSTIQGKGRVINSLLEKYKANPTNKNINPNAKAILLDDRLRQITSVENQAKKLKKHTSLVAFDINDQEDMSKFIGQMGGNQNHITNMLPGINKYNAIKEIVNANILKIENFASILPHEQRAIKTILYDLATFYLEACENEYKPYEVWANNTTEFFITFTNIYSKSDSTTIKTAINETSKKIFNNTNPFKAKSDSKCQRKIQEFLQYASGHHIIAELKTQCANYAKILDDKKNEDPENGTIEKIEFLNELQNTLKLEQDPIIILHNFTTLFNEKEHIILKQRDADDSHFYSTIVQILNMVPLIGKWIAQIFKTEHAQLTDTLIQKNTQIKIDYKRHPLWKQADKKKNHSNVSITEEEKTEDSSIELQEEKEDPQEKLWWENLNSQS